MMDINKCVGCRKGISCWTMDKGKICHLDMFASQEAGAMYPCYTEGIENCIHENILNDKPTGIYLPNTEYKQFFSDQGLWWEDLCDIAREVFVEDEKVADFFNTGEKDNMMWNQPYEVIEKELMRLVKEKGITLDPENYCIVKV